MADVVSGAVPRPRPRKAAENKYRWLTRETPAWNRVLAEFPEFATRWPTVQSRPDLAPPAYLDLPNAETYLLVWQTPPSKEHDSRGMARILSLNEDGTRCALIDPFVELSQLWASVQRHREAQSVRARGKSGPKPKPFDQLSKTQQWRRNNGLSG